MSWYDWWNRQVLHILKVNFNWHCIYTSELYSSIQRITFYIRIVQPFFVVSVDMKSHCNKPNTPYGWIRNGQRFASLFLLLFSMSNSLAAISENQITWKRLLNYCWIRLQEVKKRGRVCAEIFKLFERKTAWNDILEGLCVLVDFAIQIAMKVMHPESSTHILLWDLHMQILLFG